MVENEAPNLSIENIKNILSPNCPKSVRENTLDYNNDINSEIMSLEDIKYQ